MATATQTYKRSLSGSVGSGLSSVFGGGGRTYYILEHKVSSRYHKAGEAQEIIVDQIELGRDSKCQVQFDESFKTVSRRHAAIVRDGDNWKLIHLSTTNKTFLNGHDVKSEWYLQNGDEIQLSINGPKLGFIIPSGNKAKTGSIGLSRRLSLFRQQALKPYKTAMAVMATVIVLLLGGGITYGVIDYQNDLEQKELSDAKIQEIKDEYGREKLRTDSLNKELNKLRVQFKDLKKKAEEQAKKQENNSQPIVHEGNISNEVLAACQPYVYFVKIRKLRIEYNGDVKVFENVGTGSGFLLEDGRFVTARHVAQPWMYFQSGGETNDILLFANLCAYNGGSVVCEIDAYSPDGSKLSFSSRNAYVSHVGEVRGDADGLTFVHGEIGPHDFAYFKTSKTKGLAYNNKLSTELPMRTKLTILGYPFGHGGKNLNDVSPVYSEAVVAKNGLEEGYILTTATTFESGNSGGPVFVSTNNKKFYVVGIVSASEGRSTGVIVPISAVK